MMSIGLHCRLIGRPGRITAIKRFIEHATSFKDVWFANELRLRNIGKETIHPKGLKNHQRCRKKVR